MSAVERSHFRIRSFNGDSLTPISIFQSVEGSRKCLLESSLKHEETGRYSFIAVDPYCELIGTDHNIVIKNNLKNTIEKKQGLPLDELKSLLKEANIEGPIDFPLPGGALGYIGYDAFRQYEEIGSIPEDDRNMPDVHLMLYSNIIAYDHLKQKVTIVAMNPGQLSSDDELEETLEHLKEQILQYTRVAPEFDQLSVLQYTSNLTKEEYCQSVEIAKEHIRKGDIFQVVLSQRLSADFTGSAFSFYRKLRQDNPSPYMFYIDFEDYIVLGSSPESLIKVEGDQVTTNPIAGTRKRGKTVQEDELLEKELLEDEKELAEHRMLVDLGRNDLGRVCEVGSVELTKYMTIEKYQHVMHIVSEVKGRLLKNITGIDALVSTLPAGTVSGAPKIRAMQIINDLETVKRGVYSGAVGYVGFNGDLDFALAIRTMVIKDDKAYVQAGAGVVYDSVPENEYEETLNKARSLLEVTS
ncbi:anthranilate synthase component I [Jeotgalibacillus soli]|uniref:Anthranilate synthase component 1 n=1 Tax=Jeotgalibacillus soli TaxID=889306 RepID=A0A0C2VNE4_9BACL|nr:anthranilate synthase component I [Jeotgalibacillus soli]KIL45498.1 anthranilate synthase [Jeotgalibacillus soli]